LHRIRSLSTVIIAVALLVFLTAGPGSRPGYAQQPSWLTTPTAGPHACLGTDSWLLLYWGGSTVTIDEAARSCAGADRFWSSTAGRWVGFNPAAPQASDTWTMHSGEAAFVHVAALSSPGVRAPAVATATPTATPVATPAASSAASAVPVPTATAIAASGTTASRPVAPASSVIEAPPADGWPCYTGNPSCNRDLWWHQVNEVQRSEMVTFQFAPGLSSEYRYIEAIRLLAQWPEGLAILKDAGEARVKIITTSDILLPGAVASFTSPENVIRVRTSFRQSPNWMLADSLAHELKHASNQVRGVHQRDEYNDCISDEESAYQTEARFLSWLDAKTGGLPKPSEVRSKYSSSDLDLYASIVLPLASGDINGFVRKEYVEQCTSR
jgi:hypothetical protein